MKRKQTRRSSPSSNRSKSPDQSRSSESPRNKPEKRSSESPRNKPEKPFRSRDRNSQSEQRRPSRRSSNEARPWRSDRKTEFSSDSNRETLKPIEHNREDQNRDDLIFGRHTVIAAMEHERPLNRIWVLPQLRKNPKLNELLLEAKARGTVIDETSGTRLDQLTQYATHQGIVAQVGACQYLELEALITQAKAKTTEPVLIAVDGITDPHNLGAIIRSAEAIGAQGLVLPQRRAASVGATVAKVAAGALESLPIARVVNLNQALDALKTENYWIYGLTLDAPTPINQVKLSGAVVLLIGSEGKGLSAVTQKHCDALVKIPLEGHTQSLNASVAAGIGLYEIFRQRLSQKVSPPIDVTAP